MTILPIIQDPDPILRIKSSPVDQINTEVVDFINSMLETMYHEGGIGIAAIQLGRPIRALIVDIPKDIADKDGNVAKIRDPIFIINPEVKSLSEELVTLPEGCLSVDKSRLTSGRQDVTRPLSISIEYINLAGELVNLSINGNKSDYDLWFARCLQHEMDHLDGILFTDKVDKAGMAAESLSVHGEEL